MVGIGFAMGHNTFRQGPNPNGTQSADSSYHPEDEALLPWFLRVAPTATGSEPTQTGTAGRYTLMGRPQPVPRIQVTGHRLLTDTRAPNPPAIVPLRSRRMSWRPAPGLLGVESGVAKWRRP